MDSSTRSATAALDAAVRRIRRIAPPDAPYPGVRAREGDDEVLLVDAGDLIGWDGWRIDGAQHVLCPRDVMRRAGGHEVVFDDLREPLDRACGRREEGAHGWLRGEAVTAIVSLVRGTAEMHEAGLVAAAGAWWIAADGRPVFCCGSGGADAGSAADAAQELVRRIAGATDDRLVRLAAEEVVEALARPAALARRIGELEAQLFEAAAPQPITEAPARASRGGEPRDMDDAAEDGLGIAGLVGRLVDGTLAEAIAEAWRSIRARLPCSRRAGRRGLVLAGLAAAVLAVVVGLSWPAEGEGEAAQAQVPRASRAAGPAPSLAASVAPADPSPPAAEVGTEDPVAAAGALLAEWDACSGSCAEDSGLAGRTREGAVASPSRAVGLVDDYGSVAVVAVEAEGADRQLLVIERVGERWRVRDLYAAGGARS